MCWFDVTQFFWIFQAARNENELQEKTAPMGGFLVRQGTGEIVEQIKGRGENVFANAEGQIDKHPGYGGAD